jgi:hypothetical protein
MKPGTMPISPSPKPTRRAFAAGALNTLLPNLLRGGSVLPAATLVIDDERIARREGLRRVVQPARKEPAPVIVADQPWEGSRVYHLGTADWVPATGKFRMWYISRLSNGHQHSAPGLPERVPDLMHYAESSDGIHWQKPPLGVVEFDGSRRNNIVTLGVHSPCVLSAPGNFKMAAWSWVRNGFYTGTSPDGLHWKYPADPIYAPPGQTLEMITIAHHPAGGYRAFFRIWQEVRGYRRRILAGSSSRDSVTWEPPQPILIPDEEDDRWAHNRDERTEFYGMAGFPYAGQYLGFLPVFRVHRVEDRGAPSADNRRLARDQSPWDGPVEAQLVHSRDGKSWRRCEDRSPIIPRGKPGSYDAGCILHVGAPPVIVNDEVWVYYTAINTTHGGSMAEKRCTIGRAAWQMDRFVALAAESGGMFESTPLRTAGGVLELNSDAAQGPIETEVLSPGGDPLPGYTRQDCVRLTGDHLRAPAAWRARRTLPAGECRLRFWLRNARLYSYREIA